METAGRILKILRNYSYKGKTFLYGIPPSALPETTLRQESVDFVCRGECFYTVTALLKKLKSPQKTINFDIEGLCYRKVDKPVISGWPRLIENLDELPLAAWDLLSMDKYQAHNWHCFGRLNERHPYAVIYTSLGCPFNCTYCNIRGLYNGKPGIRYRSLRKVVEEIDFLVKNYKVKNIKILDEIFVLKEERVMEFCDLIIKRGYDLNMWAYARIDTINKELLKKMRQAGIGWLAYGIESGDKRVREAVAKGRFGQEAIKSAVQMTHEAGINVLGNFMFGLPEDNLKTLQETLDLAKELNCEYVNFYTTMAYPGSQLYKEAVEKKIKLPETWLGYSQLSEETLPLPTKYLSSAEVLRFRDNAFKEYFTNPGYLKMIEEKFGQETVESIRGLLKHKIKRKFA
jgi:radical SAM superfamily enzyme YgiQ (UPF0313 family)